MNTKQIKRANSHRKIRMKITGTTARPRMFVFRSANHIYAQLIDDSSGKVLASVSNIKMKSKSKKTDHSMEVGKLIAKEAMTQKIESVVFDRGGFVFHGRIKAV